MSSIFSKIINRELDSSIVYEDHLVVVIMDIAPINPGHMLVIPKDEKISFCDLSDETSARMINIAGKMAKALYDCDELGCDGVNLFLADGRHAGQEVPHAHLHVIPRIKSDGVRLTHGDNPNPGRPALDATAALIKKNCGFDPINNKY